MLVKAMKNTYITRLLEKELYRKLNSSGCVIVTGPKFCGKSTMCEQYAKSLLAKKYAIDVTKNYYKGLFRVENGSDEFDLFLKGKDIDLLFLKRLAIEQH